MLPKLFVQVLFCSFLCGSVTFAQKSRPNVVFILVDDLGWADVGFNGSKFYETPNIDRLAAQSSQFTNGYAAAPIVRQRAAIL